MPKVVNPETGRLIEVGGPTWRRLNSPEGVSPKKRGSCKKYPHVSDEFLCGPRCGVDACYPVNSARRYASAYGYSRKYLGDSPKGRCIRSCADKLKAKYSGTSGWH
jgi:hypothetical protein